MPHIERQPVARAIAVLRWLAEAQDDATGTRAIASGMGLPVTSVHRALTGLVEAGLVHQLEEGKKYALSLEAHRLGLLIAARTPWQQISLPHLRRAAREANETACFTIYDAAQFELITVARVQARHAVAVLEMRERRSLHAGAAGLAVLAALEPATVDAYLDASALEQETPNTITQRAALLAEIAATRARGYALTFGQRIPGAVGVGVDVRGHDAQVIGCLYFIIPEQRFVAAQADGLADILFRCRDALCADLGVVVL